MSVACVWFSVGVSAIDMILYILVLAGCQVARGPWAILGCLGGCGVGDDAGRCSVVAGFMCGG